MKFAYMVLAGLSLLAPRALADDCYEYYNSVGELVAACPGDPSYDPPPGGSCRTSCDQSGEHCVAYCSPSDQAPVATRHRPADCTWGVDPMTGQFIEVCGASSGGGCRWGVNPATGQYTEVCG